MRALIVLVGLVATPFLAAVSQQVKPNSGVGHDDAHCGMRYTLHPSATDINKCPAPTPTGGGGGTGGITGGDTGGTCRSSAPGGGTASIDGQVFKDVEAELWPGLSGWCVQLSGPVSASTVTDGSGNYLFSGVPAGVYTICETVQAGWHQTFPLGGPSCPSGFGWTINVADSTGNGYINFGNLTP